ncbi:hypothetical protein TUN199_11858 [Pyrenophora tritici-repentis]|nr:hypothetical protein Alg130_11769 [Pyrenophora tritici-repentis]KAI0604099.1 hypothetical protein TUN205_11654 [Pyrenophora tritici-repentis]KAI0616154.1 hypothetical protein TUN199_11858 [Pyrenophora tritici-repentis]
MPCDHPLGIVGGYYVVILMKKVPGVRLSRHYLSELSPTERDEIREAFKIALMDVWNCDVVSHDTAFRNIMWDPEERKCYIIDYEECDIVEGEAQMPEEFTDKQFEWWDLTERHFCHNFV